MKLHRISSNTFWGFGQSVIVAKYESLNFFSSSRFVILLAVNGLAAVVFTILTSFRQAPTALEFYSSWLGSGAGTSIETYLIALGAIMLAGDAICGEYESKIAYFSLAVPVSRSSIYFGKIMGSFIVSFLTLLIFVLAAIGNGLYYYGASALLPPLGESFLLSILFMAAAVGLVCFVSSLFLRSSTAIIVSALLFVFGFVLLQDFTSLFMEPWFLLSYGSQVVSNVFLASYPAHISGGAANAITGGSAASYNPTVLEGIMIMAGYLLLSFFLGLFVFERREFS